MKRTMIAIVGAGFVGFVAGYVSGVLRIGR